MVHNLLTDLMPDDVREDLMDSGVPFAVVAGERLPEDKLRGDYVFIVTDGIASKFQRSVSGQISEVAMVGNEGMFPNAALLDVPSAPHIVIAQIGKLEGRRVRTKDFQRIVSTEPSARALIHRYIYAFMTQIASNIMTAEQSGVRTRIARWLLMCHDRLAGDDIPVTHDTLAQMSFAHRPTVTNVLRMLKEEGVVGLGRGCVTILSRAGLINLADGSYGASERYWRRHIGWFGKDEPGMEESLMDTPGLAATGFGDRLWDY
jgi:CRP-like cAMP-binding protein